MSNMFLVTLVIAIFATVMVVWASIDTRRNKKLRNEELDGYRSDFFYPCDRRRDILGFRPSQIQ